MKPEDIAEVDHHYSRQIRGQTITGRISVGQVYHLKGPGRGWYVIGTDKATKRQITLRPKNVLKRVRVR